MLTMMQKRADFAGWLEDLLQVHETRFRVETLERKELYQAADRKTRVSVMGSPCYYATVYDNSGAQVLPDGLDGAGNVCDYEAHSFAVRIFWQLEYSASLSGSEQERFEAAVYNASDAAKPGLLATIRENRTRTVFSQQYFIGSPGGDAFQSLIRGIWDLGDVGRPEFTHYISFTVTLY